MWENIPIDDDTGSEGGIVIKDEEYRNSCRITLEKCEKYYAITCGIYGAMVHTKFCGNDHDKVYSQMKKELQSFIDNKTTIDEEIEFYEKFTTKYE